jgi:hypothetical protein
MKKLLVAVVIVAGCTSDNTNGVDNTPHALGTITLGESHPPNGGQSSPIVSASFIPDAATTSSCNAQLAGCTVIVTPTCTGCQAGEFCAFDGGCNAVCKKVCNKACGTGQVCILDAANQPTCVLSQSFDAGPLAFSGTTTAITLFPPYAYQAMQQGAPFLGGAQLEVQAQGAAGAGFAAFDEKYTATTFLQTLVPLDQIPRTSLFGSDAAPVDWVAGHDQIVVTASGAGGVATCKADDSSGHFDVPRAVLEAAIGTGTSLTLSVSRQRHEIHKGKSAMGPLPGFIVQSEGWLELVTLSTESTGFTGCGAGKQACGTGSACADLATDDQNCGACGVKCASAQICVAGQCVDPVMACNDCYTAAMSGKCKSSNNACLADAECAALRTCIDGCATDACVQDCGSQHQAGQTSFNNYIQCVCDTACTAECAGSC